MKGLFVLLTVLAIALAKNPFHDTMRKLMHQSKRDIAEHSWVVIVAGSTGWSNYRHQSDMCHAYQLVHRAGVPDERIIVFMNDDIANSVQNPFPGQIFNYPYDPSGTNVNVYEGVPKDYIKQQATAANLVKVLTGEDMTGIGSGKTLKSTAEDNVFIFYDDHGNTGILAMPSGPVFTEAQLSTVLQTMEEKKMYKQLIGFFSACYSGSMLYRQTVRDNVYFASAAPIDASSYACYYDSRLRTYIDSCWPFGVVDSIENNGLDVTFETVFSDAYNYAFNQSSVRSCQYGDVRMKANTFSGFLNGKDAPEMNIFRNKDELKRASPVPQYLVPYEIARRNYESTHSEADRIEFDRQRRIRKKVDMIFKNIVTAAAGDSTDSFLYTKACQYCDDDCECYTECIAAGKMTKEQCERHCCNYLNCFQKGHLDGEQYQCAADLTNAFFQACGQIGRAHV